jgi:hypothetical protein
MPTIAAGSVTPSRGREEAGPAPAAKGRLSTKDLYISTVVAIGVAGWIVVAVALLSTRLALQRPSAWPRPEQREHHQPETEAGEQRDGHPLTHAEAAVADVRARAPPPRHAGLRCSAANKLGASLVPVRRA